MSDLDARRHGVRFVPASGPADTSSRTAPGVSHLLLGVYLPLLTVMIELVSRMCADGLFDPIPTWAHVLAVMLVPAVNAIVWLALGADAERRLPDTARLRWLAVASGISIAIAGFYALVFLPLAPLALVALLIGVGILPLAPLLAFVSALKLGRALIGRHRELQLGRRVAAGIAAGIAMLLALDVPPAATRLGVDWAVSGDADRRERGLALLRWLGDDDLLLRLCYDSTGRPSGLLSGLVMLGDAMMLEPRQRRQAQSPAQVREVYYRVHGVPFNARPEPFGRARQSLAADLQWDADHGGTSVGGRIKGLDIVGSRIDGTIRGDEATAYLEWVVELRNTSPLDREARMQVMLPPGGVVSRATLWVNGEEREAAYGGRGEVRAAYERVAVQQRRDPLLVTSKGADRVLAQAFPVPRNGGTITFKLGVTAPLELLAPDRARLVLPAIVDRNFSFGSEVRHQLWIESRQPLSVTADGLTASTIEPRLHRVAGPLADAGLARRRPAIMVARDASLSHFVARSAEGASVAQHIAPAAGGDAPAMMIVVDGSSRVKHAAADILAALDAVPEGAKVGVLIAAEPIRRIAPRPWSGAHKRAVAALIGAADFRGGQDNAPAIAEALLALEGEAGGKLLWIHGPQPVGFRGSAARLEQATQRLRRLPQVLLYETEPGPNELLPDMPWAWAATAVPRASGAREDLKSLFARELGGEPLLIVQRNEGAGEDAAARGSDHIARLWAKDRVIEMMQQSASANRAAAVALAAAHRLVTPVSGAVVLEMRQQYEESRLTPVSQSSVPAVPEPHEWALIVLALAALGWAVHRHRERLGAA